MKKIITLLLALTMLLSLIACAAPAETTVSETPMQTKVPAPKLSPTEDSITSEAPTQIPTPEPTSIQATSRQDLIDYGFKVNSEYGYGAERYEITSRLSGCEYGVSFSEEASNSWSYEPYTPVPCIENITDRLRFHLSLNDNLPTIQYFPNCDTEIATAVYKDLEGHKYYQGMAEGFYYVIDINQESMKVYPYGCDPVDISEYVEKYVDLAAMQREAIQKYQEFNDNIQKEFGLTVEEMLVLK